MKKIFTSILMTSMLGLISCANSNPTPEAATQNTVQPTTEQISQFPPTQTDTNNAQTDTNNAQTDTNNAQTDTNNAQTDTNNAQTDTNSEQTDTNSEQTDNTVAPPPQDIDYAAMRKAALADIRTGESTSFDDFWFAIDNDPVMTATLYDEVKPHGTNSLSALGGGSTVSLRYKDTANETLKAAIKPDQDLRQTMYRSEIAYYRLCQILECSYDVPVTRPIKFSQSDFYTLYNASDSKKNKAYRSKFEHLIWENEFGTKFIYAAHKQWIESFEFFPIEVTGAWSPYLKNPNAAQPSIEKFIQNLLASARPDAPKSSTKILRHLEGKTTNDVLHQISDMILIDYLTNNWDRFSGSANNYGANCHLHPGGLIAIDNGAAFPPWHAPRVVRRLHMVETFSRTLVTNLRLINPDELLARLFPNPTHEERKSLQRFKERHADALKYIDKLIAKKGEENVLVFD